MLLAGLYAGLIATGAGSAAAQDASSNGAAGTEEVDPVTRRILSDPFITLRFVALSLETTEERGQALGGIVRAHLARGEVEAALTEIGRIENPLWRGRALASLGLYHQEEGDSDAALSAFADAVAALDGQQIGIGETDLLQRVAVEQAALGALGVGIATARRVPDPIARVEGLQRTSQAVEERGAGDRASIEAARQALRAAFQEARTIPETTQRIARMVVDIGETQVALGDIEAAAESFRHARRLIEYGERNGRNESLAKLSAAMVGAGMQEEAMEIVRLVERGQHQVRALSLVARALGDDGNLDAAVPLFTLAKEASAGIPDNQERAEAIAFMIRQLVQVDRFADAFTAAGAISDRRLQSIALFGMADELLNRGNADAALILIDYIPYISMRAQIFGRAARIYHEAGKVSQGQALLLRAFDDTGYDPDPEALPDAVRIVLESQVDIGDPLNDRTMFAEIRRLAALIPDDLTRVAMMSRLAAAEAMRGDPEGANKTLSSAWRNAWLNRDDPMFPEVLEGIVEGQVAVGDILNAFDTAARIPEPDADRLNARAPSGAFLAPRFRALRHVAVAAARAGETDLAIRAARSIQHPPARADCLASIAVALAERDNGELAGVIQGVTSIR